MRDDLLDLGERWFGYEMGLAYRKTFSCPSWYKGKKMFAFLYEDALGVKCDPAREAENHGEPGRVRPLQPRRWRDEELAHDHAARSERVRRRQTAHRRVLRGDAVSNGKRKPRPKPG